MSTGHPTCHPGLILARLSQSARLWISAALLLATVVVDQTVLPTLAASALGSSAASCPRAAPFDATHFSHATTIDNRFFPLIPGTQHVLQGRADGKRHRVTATVTDLTKVIDGVRTVVLLEQDFSAGHLEEAELAFFAQDDERNVWSLGEYPEETLGRRITAPSAWISGKEDAEGGIHMLAQPRLGSGWYLQGFAPAVDFLDCAKVIETGTTNCVPTDCYTDVLVTREKSPLESCCDFQLKYHAPDVGIVRIGADPPKGGEKLHLTRDTHLSPHALAHIRKKALAMDARGCDINHVYCDLAPAE